MRPSRTSHEPAGLLRRGIAPGWNAGDDDTAGNDVRPRRLDRGTDVIDVAAAVGDVQATSRDIEHACPRREALPREVLDDLVDGDVDALEDRSQDVPSPGLGMNRAGKPKDAFVLVGVHADRPQLAVG